MAYLKALAFLALAATSMAGFAFLEAAKGQPSYILLRCEFHAHTSIKEGKWTPTQLVQLYESKNYDVLAITDHNTMMGVAEAKRAATRLIVIAGQEISSVWPDGKHRHIVALWIKSTIYPRNSTTINEYFNNIHAQGGFGIIAHCWTAEYYWKNYYGKSYIDAWEYKPYYAPCDSLLKAGETLVYTHDTHGVNEAQWIGYSYTILIAHNRTEAAVRESLESNRLVMQAKGKLWGTSANLALYWALKR